MEWKSEEQKIWYKYPDTKVETIIVIGVLFRRLDFFLVIAWNFITYEQRILNAKSVEFRFHIYEGVNRSTNEGEVTYSNAAYKDSITNLDA